MGPGMVVNPSNIRDRPVKPGVRAVLGGAGGKPREVAQEGWNREEEDEGGRACEPMSMGVWV